MIKHYFRMSAYLISYCLAFVYVCYFWWQPAVDTHGIWTCFAMFLLAPLFFYFVAYMFAKSYEDYIEDKRYHPQATRKPLNEKR